MSGETLGPYRIDRELGAGGMGKVYAATTPDGAKVAVKVVHAHMVEQPGARERFLREALSGLSIASPNVVRTIECLETEVEGKRVPALVLEFVEGRDLAALLDETNRVPEDLCRHLAREVARGLEAIHAAGIVHRDMKPGNVLLTTAGDVKVMDLGLARQASGEDRMSQTGMFLGTAAYAPPEQFFGKKDLDPRSDLYSLGAMLFELATGRVPFRAEAIGDLVRQVLRDKAPRLGTLAPQTTPFFEELVATLLEKQPERRFASAAELGEVLDTAEAGDWWTAVSVRVQLESHKPLRRVRVQRETELWGREDDLAELRGLWDRAKGGRGAVVLLEGEAGIGKTRLVEELLAAIETEDDAQILVGRHDPAGAGSAAEALGAAFRAHLGTDDVDARLRELLPETPLLVPAFAALLRGEPAPADSVALTPDSLRTLFVSLARALAAEAPLVLVVDDLHFATDEGRALFQAVGLAAEGSPLLLVGTARPGLPAKWVDAVTRRENAARHEVRRLDEETVRTSLVRHLGGGWEAESVAAQVASRAGGNPYFVVEVLRQLGERGHLARTTDGAWRVTSMPAELALPATVRELVARRLAALAAADRDLLETAACQGHEFDGRLVAESLARPRMEVLRALGRLEHATCLVRAAGARFAFDHHTVHEVLYAGQADDARRGRHGALANALEARHGAATQDPATLDGALCADLCSHFLKAGLGERAHRYLDSAFASLERGWKHHAAIDILERSLAAPGLFAGAERDRALLRLAAHLGFLGRREPQRAAIEEAIAGAQSRGDRRAEADAIGGLGQTFWALGRLTEALSCAERQLAIAQEIGDTAAEERADAGLGLILWSLGRFDEARERHERCLALAREQGNTHRESAGSINLGLALWSLGRLAEARTQYERGIRIAQQCGYRQWEANGQGNLGLVLGQLSRFDEALACHERPRALAREIGDRRGETLAEGNLGHVLGELDRLGEAREHRSRHLALAREIGDRLEEARALANLAALHRSLGGIAVARSCAESSVAIAREIGARSQQAYSLDGLSSAAKEEGDHAAAVRHAEESLAIRREIGHADGIPESLVALGDRRRDAGDTDGARRALLEARELLGAQSRHWLSLACIARLANLPGGDAAAAEVALAEADRSTVGSDVLFLAWQATGDRAHLVEARRHLDRRIESAPPECRESMLTNVRVNREIVAACKEQGL